MNPYLLRSALLGPEAIERILRHIPENRFDEALDPERFTIREVVAHLADWEPIFRGRMEQVLATPGTTIEVFEEGERAISQRYHETDVWERLATWRAERLKTAELLNDLDDEALRTQMVHPENGVMTVGDTANMLAGHDLYHVSQLVEYL
jgi:uncharacterized damage-inducible protein DinB